MIWWGAIRKDPSIPVNPLFSACVRRSELQPFLLRVLQKLGLREKELKAFPHYWDEVFNTVSNAEINPYLL